MAGNGTMVCVYGGGSIAVVKYHLGLITNAFSDSSVVYYESTIRSVMGLRSHLDLLPFACQRTTMLGCVLAGSSWVGIPLIPHSAYPNSGNWCL